MSPAERVDALWQCVAVVIVVNVFVVVAETNGGGWETAVPYYGCTRMFIAVVVHQGSGLQHGHTDASVYALKGVAGCHCTLSGLLMRPQARKPAFHTEHGTVWSIRAQATVRKGNPMNLAVSFQLSVFRVRTSRSR